MLLIEEKRSLLDTINQNKKDCIQVNKQAKLISDNNRIIEEDVSRLTDLVVGKQERNHIVRKEAGLVRREVRNLQQDVDELR